MNLLLINTCGAVGLVAIATDGGVIAEEQLPGRASGEMLLPVMRRLLEVEPRLDAVAVVHGPGSFTGVRVGLSAAKGLCEARGIGLVALSRLALVAAEARGEEVLALLDAGRGEYFCGVSRPGRMEREELLRREQVLPLMAGRETVTCEARVQESGWDADVRLVAEPGAREMLAMALRRIAASEWSDVAATDANYLRRTDAEILAESR